MPDVAMADRACADRDCEAAIRVLERAVLHQPANFALYYRLGVCYGGGCRRRSLNHPEMAGAYLRQAVRLSGGNPGPARAAVLEELGNALLRGPGMPMGGAMREAIECHRAAARVYERLGRTHDRARLEFNLGNSFCDLSDLTGENHWQEAISHYQRSLEIRTREADPEGHAAVLENLGAAYRRLPAGDAGANVKKSIQCYRRALWIYTSAAHPAKNAAVHNNLGNAFLSLPRTGTESLSRNARRALRHFERALQNQPRQGTGRAYGIAQYNRAQAYFQLGRASPAVNLPLAVGCLKDAYAAFASCGEDRYAQLIQAQLEWICRPREGRTSGENPSPAQRPPLSASSGAK